MLYLKSFLFSITQGITEFLPVSSSGHLVFLNALMKNSFHSLSYDLFLHLATFVAVLVFFYKDIKNILLNKRSWLYFIFIGSIPTAFAGIFFKSVLESLFDGGALHFLSLSFLITSVLVFAGGRSIEKNRGEKCEFQLMDGKKAFVIGAFQAVAIIPGVSRSGSTISAALLLGLAPGEAFVFSFLLSIPAVGGAFLLDFWQKRGELFACETSLLIFSFLVAFATGLLSLFLLKKAIVNRYYKNFAYYTLCLSLSALVLFFAR